MKRVLNYPRKFLINIKDYVQKSVDLNNYLHKFSTAFVFFIISFFQCNFKVSQLQWCRSWETRNIDRCCNLVKDAVNKSNCK